MKRIITFLLIAAMVLSLTACGKSGGERNIAAGENQGNTSEGTDSDKLIELTVYSQLANYNGEQVGWSAKLLEDLFNVKITIIPDDDGVFDTRMESGTLGDIVVFGSTGNDYQRAVKSGMLYDWNKFGLLDQYGTAIRDNMPKALQANRDLTKLITDGASDALYGFGHNVSPSSDNHEEFFYTWDIRWDLYKQLGYPIVKDMDDLVTLFERMKEICPADDNGNPTYAASLWPDWDGNMVMYVKAMATTYFGYDELAMGLYDPDTGTMHDALEENGPYLQCLKFFNTLYQKGLLDPNSATQTYDSMFEKLQAGGVFFSIFNYSGSLGYNTEEHLTSGKYMYTMVPEQAIPITYGMSVFGGNRIWTIGANTEYPDVCMKIINYLSTPEGRLNFEYGPKGLMWDYNEEGNTYLTELGLKCKQDKTTPLDGEFAGSTFHDGEFQINNSTWSINAVNPDSKSGETYNWELWKSTNESVSYDIQKDWKNYTGCSSIADYMEKLTYRVSPASEYVEGERSDEFDILWNQVKECIVEYSWKAMYAKNDGEYNYLVNEMIKKAKAYGYDKCREWSVEEAKKRHECEEAVKEK